MSLERRTHVKVVYEGVDITADVSKDLVAFRYTDNEGGQADDISLTLKNNHGLWSGAWKPTKGDSVTATIITEDDSGSKSLSCGSCEIDKLKFAGPPSLFEIGGVSIPLSNTVRRTKKSRAWEAVRLSEICTDVSNTAGVDLIFQPNPAGAEVESTDPLYNRRDQRDESDLSFIKRLCDDEGLSVKMTDQQLVIYNQDTMAYQDPSVTFTLGESNVVSYDFEEELIELYNKAIVSYSDPRTGNLNTFEYTDSSITNGQTLKIIRRTESSQEAERIAKAALSTKNRRKITCNLVCVGSVSLVSGITVYLSGFGDYDGKYYVQKCEHNVQNGYTSSLEMIYVGAS